MDTFRRQLAFNLLLPLVLALIIWFSWSPLAASLLLAACYAVIVIYHVRQLDKFSRWLENPQPSSVPQGFGIWDDVFARLYAYVRGQISDQHTLTSLFERFQSATRALPDGLVILDEMDQIEWLNPVAERHFGIQLAQDRGQPIHYLIRQSQFGEYLHTANYIDPLIIRSSRNADLTLSIQIIPFGDSQKLMISRDISQLERVETMRRDFVANVSHELKTPLTVINGFLETFIDNPPHDEALMQRYFALLLEQARRMQRIIEGLLTLSRLETASLASAIERIDMPQVMQALYNEAQSLSNGRHQIELETRSATTICGNGDELHGAFLNLISNAIRYTPEGGTIRLVWSDDGQNGRFSVEDSGIGIEAEHLPRLTERFYRVDKGRARATGGTGLGLSIVKHVLARHGGVLQVESEPGRGSRFSAQLPLINCTPTAKS